MAQRISRMVLILRLRLLVVGIDVCRGEADLGPEKCPATTWLRDGARDTSCDTHGVGRGRLGVLPKASKIVHFWWLKQHELRPLKQKSVFTLEHFSDVPCFIIYIPKSLNVRFGLLIVLGQTLSLYKYKYLINSGDNYILYWSWPRLYDKHTSITCCMW